MAEWAHEPDYGWVVVIGTSGPLGARIGVEPDSGEVVYLHANHAAAPFLVNSGIAALRATAEVIVDRYPFYSELDDGLAIDRAAAEIAERIERVDPRAMQEGKFWPAFVDSVQMGDFSSERVEGRVE